MKGETRAKIVFYILSILTASLCFVPGLFFVVAFLSSTLISWCTARFGLVHSIWGLPLLFVAGFLSGDTFSACFLCAQALSAFMIGMFIYKKGKFSGMLITATLVEVTAFAVYTRAIADALSQKPATLLFGENLQNTAETILNNGQLSEENVSMMHASIRMLFETMQSMLPFFYLVSALVVVYLVFAVTRFILEKQSIRLQSMPRFCEFWLPRSISNIFVILFLISFFANTPILTNVVSVMFFIHVVCGISVIDLYMKGRGMSRGIRALLLVALFTVSAVVGGLGTSILCCIGMNDRARSSGK